MNANLFRLVFNHTLGMYVPAHEAARSRGKDGGAARPAAALVALFLGLGAAPSLAQMPVPCAGGACGVNPNPTAFVSHGAAGYAIHGNQGIVSQTTNKAILNWQSYNLGAGNTLTYRFQDGAGNLPAGASFATLNRIWQGSPSEIAGRIQVQAGQNGQITLINQNGILFKDGAQINVGSLTASTLNITDALFLAGIQSNADAGGVAAFLAEGAGGGLVRVETGAELRTASGGRVMLLAESVENHGLIETPEGQTILAAGAKVYLAVSDDPGLRGFLVEVDSPVAGGGAASNSGRIIAERGNVSMTGLTVNQTGRISATTSANLNGTIRLMARDTVSAKPKGSDPTVTVPTATRTGQLVFGAGSVTEVLPEVGNPATLTDEQSFTRSRIEGVGRVVHVRENSVIRATAGDIALTAQAGENFQNPGDPRVEGVRIQVDSGALLDTSGLRDVPIPVERNYLQVEVRGDQLKDAPLQRDGFLYKSLVWVDVEQGTPLLNVAADIAKLERTVAEKSTAGGGIVLRAEGDLVLRAGATLDVSGGSIAYQAGYGRTTLLVQNGKIVDIGVADPELNYDGFADQYSVTDAKWNQTRTFDFGQPQYVEAYTAGRDAGRISLSAHNMALDASLRGEALPGARQRQSAPAAGRLALTLLTGNNTPATQIPDLSFIAGASAAGAVGLNDALPAHMVLSADLLERGGFGGLTVYSDGRIRLAENAALDAGARGKVSLTGRRLDIDGEILAPGGEISLTTQLGRGQESLLAADYGLNLGALARLDVAGRWVNDLPSSGATAGYDAVVIGGGRIALAAYADLELAAGSVLDASGGAWMKPNGKTSYGAAGAIELASGGFGQQNASDPRTTSIHLGGELRAYGMARGGSLTVRASSLHLGAHPSGAVGELAIDEAFFADGGFSTYHLSGADGVRVADGFQLRPAPLSAQLDSAAGLMPSNTPMAAITTLVALDEELRAPSQVSLTATNAFLGDVHVGEGAAIHVDTGGAITLTAARQLSVLGTLAAPAGSITLAQPAVLDGEREVANFDAGRSIFLGADSRLLAAGHFRAIPDPQGLRKGELRDGGTVTITAAKGYLVTQAGSLIDVSGTTATLDLIGPGRLVATAVASDGGAIRLAAREGMLLEGDLRAAAGGVMARGGSLDVHLARLGPDWFFTNTQHPLYASLNSQRVITLQAAPTVLTAGLKPGDALDTFTLNGQARLAQSLVQAGDFADLSLRGENRIAFADTLDLSLPGHLQLHASNFSTAGAADVRLAAASVSLGRPDRNAQAETLRNDASGGAGTLRIDAGLIELVGHASLQGFGATHLSSQGDIRLRDVAYALTVNNEQVFRHDGSLVTGGDLHLAARQIYPTSMTQFALEVHNNPQGRITVVSTGADGVALSAGGRLSLSAPFIEQRGTLKAPFGEIALNAEHITRVTNQFGIAGLPSGQNPIASTRAAAVDGEVLLAPGSLTSVSARGQIIPLGRTELSGGDWIYDFGLFKQVIAAPPEKQITLEGANVQMAGGAVIDLSGGGELYAYEFLSGPGGSRDILAAEHSAGLYAVLPGHGRFAAYDTQTYLGLEDWNPGASVRLLEGAHGLPAGDYALLPARYALLPGAYLVRVRTPASDLTPGGGGSLDNGAALVAGYLGSATAAGGVAHGGRVATLEIRPGGDARKYSEFIDTYASVAFATRAGAQLPGDAGRLSMVVGQSLSLQGELRADYASGRRGSEVDISADKLAVTASGASFGAGYVSLGVEQLDSLGAASLLLGGTRGVAADGERVWVTQRSDELVIANDADHVLSAPELILVARDTLKLEDGAVVAGVGEYSGQAKDLYVTDTVGNGDGGLLRVSTGDQVALSRAPASLAGGVLDVAAGATVRAGKSAILDATLDNRTLGAVILPEAGGALTLGATRISLVADGTQVNTSGLVFGQERLAALGNPAHVLLRSYSTLDLYGDVKLGGVGLASLGIEAAGLAGYGAAGQQATLQADTVSIANPDGIAAASAFTGMTGEGELVVLARDVALGQGDVESRGFDSITVTATGQLLGRGGSLKVAAGGGADGHLTLNAGRITVAAGADQSIEADGDLVIGLPAMPTTTVSAALGGKLALSGASLTHGGRIDMPAGIVALKAKTGDVTLLSGGEILAGGASVDFADTRAFAGGGSVSLIAELGDVVTQTGSTIDVGGDIAGGDAGALAVWAAGDAKIAGTLLGEAVAGFDSGRFELTADRINPDTHGDNDFSALNGTLEAGGFHASRRIRLRQGDIELAATDAARAHEFILSADQGDIRVAGTVDAGGGKGGRIELFAGGDLELLSGARLLAMATDGLVAAEGTAGEGGRVVLGSGDNGVLSLAAGSRIDVSVPTGSAARAGRVVLRAARSGAGAGTGVAFGALAGEITGAERVEVEAYKVYVGADGTGITELTTGASSGSKLGLTTVQADNNAFVAAVDLVALKDQLDTGAATFHLLPGVEARNPHETAAGIVIPGSGDMTLSADWNLYPLRHGGEAGVLTLRAAGDLKLAANLSDGFSTATTSGLLQASPITWSYRLVAGADTVAADPLATGQGAAGGSVNLSAGKLARTGSGRIEVAAAGDFLLGAGAALYTAGHATPAVAGFTVTGLSGTAFPTGGGDLQVRVAGNVIAEHGPSGLLTDWLYRQGNVAVPNTVLFRAPGWWPQFAQFSNGVAALGGGDVEIQAGGRVANLLAATVTNARQPATFGQAVDAGAQVIRGGGDLRVRAGDDIEGGLFHVDRGNAHIASDGAFTAGLARANQSVGTVLSVGDAGARLSARRDMDIESVVNHSLVPQRSGNLSGTGGNHRESYFVTYATDSAARLLSVAGDIRLRNDLSTLTAAYDLDSNKSAGLALYPGTLEMVAPQGDLDIAQGFTLTPSALGDVRLLAGGSIVKRGVDPIHLSDMALSRVPTLATPTRAVAGISALVTLPEKQSDAYGPELLHRHDLHPAYVVARTGDIVGEASPLVFAVLAKAAVFQAGRDIRNATVVGQNMRADDVTRFLAGRDIVFATERDPLSGAINSFNASRIVIGGPGWLELIAGRDIDLGTSQGVVTRGNLTNPYLPEGGADLLVLAGVAASDAAGGTLPIDVALLNVQTLDAFFAELAASAAESAANQDYSRGEAAIAALFPTGTPGAPLTYQGDISLFFSQLKTEQGGGIRMLAPGGEVNAGLASVSGFNRAAADLGIMTVRGGDIEAYTLGDFQVNSSRVFTISGGDILLWSAEGNIDAGKGAKSASATPPPQLRIDNNGNFVLDVSQSIAGSGIGALSTGSNVALIAPRGEVNAGDAGIRAGGNLTIAAERVVGADNIQVGGIATGVQVTDTGNLSGSLAGVGNLADNTGEATRSVAGAVKDEDARNAQEAKQMLAAFKPTFINVEVLGFGEGTASVNDAPSEAERKRREEERRAGGARG